MPKHFFINFINNSAALPGQQRGERGRQQPIPRCGADERYSASPIKKKKEKKKAWQREELEQFVSNCEGAAGPPGWDDAERTRMTSGKMLNEANEYMKQLRVCRCCCVAFKLDFFFYI